MNAWELHPALVHFPIALLLSATALDVVSAWRRSERSAGAAAGLMLAGVASAIVAAGAGVLAYFTVPTHSEAAHVRMLIHPALAGGATILYAVAALRRWKRRSQLPSRSIIVVSIVAAALLIAAGGLGGYLVFRDGVGVERTQRAGDHEHVH